MKTHDEIKNGIECCEKYMNGAPEEECCHVCNYQYDCAQLKIDIIALIRQLEAQNAEKAERIQQLEAERDAMTADFKLYRERNINHSYGVYACDLCKYGGDYYEIEEIKCPGGCDGMTKWEWRGVQKEE